MLVHSLGLVELALALKVHGQVVQVAHHRVAHRHAAEAVKGHVQLALALQSQPHHAIGFCGFFISLYLASFGDQEAFGGEGQMAQ